MAVINRGGICICEMINSQMLRVVISILYSPSRRIIDLDYFV